MGKNNELKRIKLNIIFLAILLCVMACFFGLIVYAMLNQNLKLNTQIIVSDQGQAKSQVCVYEFFGPNDNSNYNQLNNEPMMNLVLQKDKDEDYKGADLTKKIVFGGVNSYRYLLLKIEIKNLSSVNIEYSLSLINDIGEQLVLSSQLDYLFLQNTDNDFSLVESERVGQLSVEEEVTRYLAIYIKDEVELDQLINVGMQNFHLKVEVNAIAN